MSPRRNPGLPGRARSAVLSLLLALLVAGIYLQTAGFGFVFDDFLYVADNRHVNGGLTWQGVRTAFSGFSLGFWHPLTLLSHMLDVSLFGLQPAGHHLTAVLLHTTNTILCFLVLRGCTGSTWPAALAAALFGLHPLRAESVAYISERKDVLSALFWFLTLAAWLRHLRHPSAGRYLAALGVFTVGLTAKPMLVTLPFVLLLLDFWPLDRLRQTRARLPGRLLYEKIPFLLLSIAASALAYLAQDRYGALSPVHPFALPVRLLNALYAYGYYLWKTIWPSHLAAFYPHPGPAIPGWALAAAAAALATLSCLVLFTIRRRPYLTLGWLWFLGTLVPVIGLVQLGDMGMADRFTYLPSGGLAIMVAWGAWTFSADNPGRQAAVLTVSGSVVLALALISFRQVGVWRDGVTLFSHTVAVTGVNSLARYNLGVSLAQAGRLADAEREFRRTLADDPGHLPAYDDLAAIAFTGGRQREALDILAAGLARAPGSPRLSYRMGVYLNALGRPGEAAPHLEKAARGLPRFPAAHNDLGILRANQGRLDEAERHFRDALAADPNFENARYNLSLLDKLRERSLTPSP